MSGWLTPRPGPFTSGKESRYPLCRRLGGSQGRSRRVRKILLQLEFDPRTEIFLYRCEIWRKIIRRVFGPLQLMSCRKFGTIDIGMATYLIVERLKWAGHVVRMFDNRIPRRILEGSFRCKMAHW